MQYWKWLRITYFVASFVKIVLLINKIQSLVERGRMVILQA